MIRKTTLVTLTAVVTINSRASIPFHLILEVLARFCIGMERIINILQPTSFSQCWAGLAEQRFSTSRTIAGLQQGNNLRRHGAHRWINLEH